jgi:hypothetical protein
MAVMDAATAALIGALGGSLGASALSIGGNVVLQRKALAADRRKVRREAERAILDEGAALATRFRIEMESVRRLAPAEDDGDVEPGYEVSGTWGGAVGAVRVFRAQLGLWFDDDSEVAQAFDEIVGVTQFAAGLRLGSERTIDGLSVDEAVAGVLKQLDEAEDRYLTAARKQLRE